MALYACGECGKPVSEKAESCPNCGAPAAGKKGSCLHGCSRLLAIFVGLPILIVMFLAIFDSIDFRRRVPTDPPDPTPPSQTTPKPANAPKLTKRTTSKAQNPARNQMKKSVAQPTVKTPPTIHAPTLQFSIVRSNIFLHHKRSLDVRLDEKLPKDDLINLAHYLKAQDPKKYDRTFILFYLPGMKLDAGAWASGHFNPNFELKYFGLSLEDEKAVRVHSALGAGEERIGRWLQEGMGPLSGQIEFIKKGKGYEMRKAYSDESIGTNALSRRWTFGGYRYFKEGKTGSKDDYFKITKNNGLEIWSFDPLKGKRILADSLKPIVASSPVSASLEPETSGRKTEPPRQTQETRTSASEAWYSGGTLHKAKMREWSRSSYRNRLATSSDFTAKLLDIDGKRIPPIDQLKPLAMLLEHNISTANSGGVADDQKVSDVAAACWILLKKGRK